MLTSRRFWLGAAITAGFLALLLAQVDYGELGDALASAQYAYVVPAVVIYFGSLYFRSVRWRYMLRPFVATRVSRLYPVVVVGYTANNLLPMRLGELVRSYYLSRREPVRGSTALATIIVERVFDGLTLLLFLAIGALFLPVSGLAERVSEDRGVPLWGIGTVVVVPFAAALTLIALTALRPETARALAVRLALRLPGRVARSAGRMAAGFIDGFEGLHHPRRLLTVLTLSAPIWLAEGMMYYVLALGFGLDEPLGGRGATIAAMLVVTAVSNLATSIPASQGAVGPFEFFATLSLVFLGVGTDLALAYAIVLHAALLLPVIGAGLLHLAMARLSLGELTRGQGDQAPEAHVEANETE